MWERIIGDNYKGRYIYVDEGGTDEDICEIDQMEADKLDEVVYRPYYHKKYGLYAAWDESKPHGEKIILQKIV